IGSSNGAATHLFAALRIPWLPQTVLTLVRRGGIDVDEPKRDLAWARAPARDLLAGNPDIDLHHMHDPNQDRLMLRHVAYFRIKRAVQASGGAGRGGEGVRPRDGRSSRRARCPPRPAPGPRRPSPPAS